MARQLKNNFFSAFLSSTEAYNTLLGVMQPLVLVYHPPHCLLATVRQFVKILPYTDHQGGFLIETLLLTRTSLNVWSVN